MMLSRLTTGERGLGGPASIALLSVTILGALWLAARIYSAGVLLYGQRPGLRAIWGLVSGRHVGSADGRSEATGPDAASATICDVADPSDATLWHGDSRELLGQVEDASVDLICTDPPYNLGGYSTGNIDMSWRKSFNNDVAAWDQTTFEPAAWLAEFRRVLKPTGTLFAFTSLQPARPLARGLRPGLRHVPVRRLAQDEPAAEAPPRRLPQLVRADRRVLGQGPHLELRAAARHAQLHRGARSARAGSARRTRSTRPRSRSGCCASSSSGARTRAISCSTRSWAWARPGSPPSSSGRRFVGIELDESYVAAARRRIEAADVTATVERGGSFAVSRLDFRRCLATPTAVRP